MSQYEVIRHSATKGRQPNSFVGNPNTSGPNNEVRRMIFKERDSGLFDNENGVYVICRFELQGGYNSGGSGTTSVGVGVDYDPRHYNETGRTERIIRNELNKVSNVTSNEIAISPSEVRKAADYVDAQFKKYRSEKAHQNHSGYYSPNLVRGNQTVHRPISRTPNVTGSGYGVRRRSMN